MPAEQLLFETQASAANSGSTPMPLLGASDFIDAIEFLYFQGTPGLVPQR
jgi:hypothetical protein